VRWIKGVPSPMKEPERLDVVIFRENTEDVYAGIEWASGTEAERVRRFLVEEMGAEIREGSGIGIKPISPFGTKRHVAAAIRYALDRKARLRHPRAQGEHHEVHRGGLLRLGVRGRPGALPGPDDPRVPDLGGRGGREDAS
jgi:hypothetical protein